MVILKNEKGKMEILTMNNLKMKGIIAFLKTFGKMEVVTQQTSIGIFIFIEFKQPLTFKSHFVQTKSSAILYKRLAQEIFKNRIVSISKKDNGYKIQ